MYVKTFTSSLKGCDNEQRLTTTKRVHESLKEVRVKHQETRNTSKGKSNVKFNDLDPMDPASYSDIPRYQDNLNKFNHE